MDFKGKLSLDPSGRPSIELSLKDIGQLSQLEQDVLMQVLRYGHRPGKDVPACGCEQSLYATDFFSTIALLPNHSKDSHDLVLRVIPIGAPEIEEAKPVVKKSKIKKAV